MFIFFRRRLKHEITFDGLPTTKLKWKRVVTALEKLVGLQPVPLSFRLKSNSFFSFCSAMLRINA